MSEQTAEKGNRGRVIQVLGAVVDVEFPDGYRPRLLHALKTTNPLLNDQPENLVLEVAQHLGDCRVRAIAWSCASSITSARVACTSPPS